MALRKLHVSHSIRTLGCMALALVPLWVVVGGIVHSFASARTVAYENTCTSNVKQIMGGLFQYTQDWDEHLPPAQQWAALSNKYVQASPDAAVWHCPAASSPYSYAFNSALGGLPLTNLNEISQTVVVFEAEAATWNASGGVQQLAKKYRHPWDGRYGFADGHVNYSRAIEVRWQPLFLPTEKQP